MSGLKNNEKGFTFIELIMVVVLISILAIVAIPKYMRFRLDAEKAVARGVGDALSTSIKSFMTDCMLNQVPYDENDIIDNTIFTGIIESTDLSVPAAGFILLKFKGKKYVWNFTDSGDCTGSIEEFSPFPSDTPQPPPPPILMP